MSAEQFQQLVQQAEREHGTGSSLTRWVASRASDESFRCAWARIPIFGDADRVIDEIEEFLTGSRRETEPDRVLATVMFTDIVPSTQRAAELGDRQWRTVLDRHDQAVREQLQRRRGPAVISAVARVLSASSLRGDHHRRA